MPNQGIYTKPARVIHIPLVNQSGQQDSDVALARKYLRCIE